MTNEKVRAEKRWVMTGDVTALGYIPNMLSAFDHRKMVDQLNDGYRHGGGWRDFDGFKVSCKEGVYSIKYPGDPAHHERARIVMGDETLVMFPYSWVMVIEADGKKRIARMD